jgi:methyl-accepting chemotaxis protein
MSLSRLSKALLFLSGVVAIIVICAVVSNSLIQLNTMASSLSKVSAQLSELHEMNQKLNLLTAVNDKLGKTNDTLAVVGNRIDSMNGKLGLLGTMASELGSLSLSLGNMSGKLDGTNAALAHTNQKLGALSTLSTLADLDRKLDALAGLTLELKQTNAGITTMSATLQNVSTGLQGMQTQLGVLTPMNESLKAMSSRIDRSLLGSRPRFLGR